MPGAPDLHGRSPSMDYSLPLSEVSGMDNSLSLAEIDRIIGNLIGQESERSLAETDENIMLDSPHGLGGVNYSLLAPDSPNVSAQFEDIPADVPAVKQSPMAQRGLPRSGASLLSPTAQRLLSPKSQFTPSPGMENMHDSPTDVPSYVSPLPRPSVNGLPSPEEFVSGRSAQSSNPSLEHSRTLSSTFPKLSTAAPELIEAQMPGPAGPGPSQGMPMPLQKITLFRKSTDGDGTAPSGRNVGIGIECETDPVTGHVVIQRVCPGGAAHNSCQVFHSDTLLQVNGTSVTGMPSHQVLKILGGEAGTPVSILVSHNPQGQMSTPRGPPPPEKLLKKQPLANKNPVPADQEAEERRLARDKVLAARRMSGVGGAGPTPIKTNEDSQPLVSRQTPNSSRSSKRPDARGQRDDSHQIGNSASKSMYLSFGDAPREETTWQSIDSPSRQHVRAQHAVNPIDAGGPSSPVSAVCPLPPASLAGLSNHAKAVPILPSNADQTRPAPSALPYSSRTGNFYSSKDVAREAMSPKTSAGQLAAGSPPEGSDIFREENEAPSTGPTDAEGKSLAELKMSFTMRMNEAIRMQRERMRVLLSDVDSKIVSLKKEHGLREREPSLGLNSSVEEEGAHPRTSSTDAYLPQETEYKQDDTDDKEHDNSAESHASSVDTIISPAVTPSKRAHATRNAPPAPSSPVAAVNSLSVPFSPGMIERDVQTEKLMEEMGQLRAALAAVTGSVASASRTASVSGEALLADPSGEWVDEDGQQAGHASLEAGVVTWLQRKRSPSLQRSAAPANIGDAEADLLVMAEQSKQKYLDIVGRLQKEALKTDSGCVDQSVEDQQDSMDSVTSSEDQSDQAEMEDEDDILTLSYNPSLLPTKGCLTQYRKDWPTRPLSPPQNEAERHRLANRGLKRSVLGAGIAASKEVLNPGQKTPYSPKHVMTPHGPMVLAPEGPVPPTQHPFVQEQMLVLKCIKQYPELAQMGAEVVKAATIRFELGFVPELVDDEEFDDDDAPRPPQNRARRSIVWGEGVAATDGNSAQKLHEASLAKRKAALAAAQAAASKHAEMLDEMQEQHDKIQQLQQQRAGPPNAQRQAPPQHHPPSMHSHNQGHPQYVQQHSQHQQQLHPQQQHHHQQQQNSIYASQHMGPPAQGTVQVPKGTGKGVSALPYQPQYPTGFSSPKSPAGVLAQLQGTAQLPGYAAPQGTPGKMGPGAQQRQGGMQMGGMQQGQHMTQTHPQAQAHVGTPGKGVGPQGYLGHQRGHAGRQSMGDMAGTRGDVSGAASSAPVRGGWQGQQAAQSLAHMRQPPQAMRQQHPNTPNREMPNIKGQQLRMSLPG